MSEAAPNPTPAPANNAAAPPAAPKSKMVTILIVLVVVLLLALGGAGGAVAFLMMKKDGGGHKEENKGHTEEVVEEKHAPAPAPTGHGALPGPTIRLQDFTIRLRNPEQDRFARFSFEVEVTEELDKDKVTKRQPRIRDSFIRYLSDRTVEDLRGGESLERIKGELQELLIETAPDARIRALYITDFVVQ